MRQAPTKTAKDLKVLEKRWGKQTLEASGWTGIPNILIERQQRLKIDAVKLNILLVLLKHWWEKDKMPFPSKKKIAEIVGRDLSTVQRHIRELEERKLIERNSRFQNGGGQTSNEYDLGGLIKALRAEAKDELKVKKQREEEDGRKRRGYGS